MRVNASIFDLMKITTTTMIASMMLWLLQQSLMAPRMTRNVLKMLVMTTTFSGIMTMVLATTTATYPATSAWIITMTSVTMTTRTFSVTMTRASCVERIMRRICATLTTRKTCD